MEHSYLFIYENNNYILEFTTKSNGEQDREIEIFVYSLGDISQSAIDFLTDHIKNS